MEGDIITMQDIFVFDYAAGFDPEGHPKGHLISTGLRPKFLSKLAQSGVHVDTSVFAFDRR
jgi:pilus assembly protein CpaF